MRVLSLFLLLFCFFVRGTEYRILVDKVYSRTADKRIPEADFAKIREMGFNVLAPRWSSLDDGSAERDLALCRKAGLGFLPWMRGTFDNTAAPERMLTLPDGRRSPLDSPNSPEFWAQLERGMLRAAALPAPNLGIFLDFEHYPNPRLQEPYRPSYDAAALKQFTAETRNDAKSAPEAFLRWSEALWRRESARLAAKVKKLNPDFRIFIYPGLRTPFLAVFADEMRKAGVPVFCAGAATYGRMTFQSLGGVAEVLGRQIETAAKLDADAVPGAVYLAGLDPAERGNSPELMELKMRTATAKGAGYWIFFEGFRRNDPALGAYEAAFRRANCETPAPDPQREQAGALPKFKRATAKKIFVSGEMRGAISKFYNAMPEYEAFDMSGSDLESIDAFDLLVLQDLVVAECDRARVYAGLRRYAENGGAILFCYSSAKNLPGIFPEIAATPEKNAAPSADKLRIFRQKKPFVTQLPYEKYSAGYLYCYPMTAGTDAAVLTVNLKRIPVVVAGRVGKGRVVFSGDYFGRREVPAGEEKEFYQALSAWLTGEKEK